MNATDPSGGSPSYECYGSLWRQRYICSALKQTMETDSNCVGCVLGGGLHCSMHGYMPERYSGFQLLEPDGDGGDGSDMPAGGLAGVVGGLAGGGGHSHKSEQVLWLKPHGSRLSVSMPQSMRINLLATLKHEALLVVFAW